MAAPRLHLGHVASRSAVSEDEEVEVLRSGVHEDDDDVEQGHGPPVVDEKRRAVKDGSKLKISSDLASSGASGTRIGNDRVSLIASDRRSETSTPEADTSEAIMAALYSSTTSEAVPDHQEASDILQDRGGGNGGNASRIRVPSGRFAANSGPFHSTPTETTQSVPETHVPSSAEIFWDVEQMKRALRFFFLNPLEKYRSTRRFPWKLSLQVVKIFIVTTQLIVFGDLRMGHASFSSKTQMALRHLFLANWTGDRDLLIYPPAQPPFSIYEIGDFYNHLTYAVQKYYVLPKVAVATLVYDCRHSQLDHSLEMSACLPPPMSLCVDQLQAAESHLGNHTYHYDMHIVTSCVEVDVNESQANSTSFSIKDYLGEQNVTIHRQKFVKATLSFQLKTIHLKRLQPADEPDCFHLVVNIDYDNSDHTGEILVTLSTVERFMKCEGSVEFPTFNVTMSVLVALLDAVVLGVCIASMVLCVRAVVRARQLFQNTRRFFNEHFGHELTRDDALKFINFWYLMIMVNDVCLIMGTIFKLTIEYQHFDPSLFTATGMLLGIGTLIVWAGILRYLAFFPKYNVLIITLKRSLPNVLRFMACAGLLYAGFVFCGWVVLGPYHMKFRTLMMTSECLFALLNGDDMFATFSTTSTASPAVLWFGRLYLYLFICLFTYVVLSLFISIIMEAYEVMKDRQQYELDHQSELDTFIGVSQFNGDNSAATGPVQPSLLGESPSPGGYIPRIRRRLSRQRSGNADDPQAPYVRFEDEPVIMGGQPASLSTPSHA